MKYSAVIVVEGKTDKALIESFLDAEIVTTNGSEVSRETIEYLKAIKGKKDVVVLTDPDSPGKRIRDVLDAEIPGLYHAYIPKDKAIKRHKVGVAESSKDAILEALNHVVPAASGNQGSLTMNDLYELGLSGGPGSSAKREALGKALHIGHANSKTFLERANSLGLSKEDIIKALNGKQG